MLNFEHVTPGFRDLDKVSELYAAAFPARERGPLEKLISHDLPGSGVIALYDENEFVGLVSTITAGDITHIIYLAIRGDLRGHNYGSQAIELTLGLFPGKRIIADLEAPDDNADNACERISRTHFYAKNGFEKTEVEYEWQGESYVIWSLGGKVTSDEFDKFWESFYENGKAGSEF